MLPSGIDGALPKAVILKFTVAETTGVFIIDYVQFPIAILTVITSAKKPWKRIVENLRKQLLRVVRETSFEPNSVKVWPDINCETKFDDSAKMTFVDNLTQYYKPGQANRFHTKFATKLAVLPFESGETEVTFEQTDFYDRDEEVPLEHTCRGMFLQLSFFYLPLPQSKVDELNMTPKGTAFKQRVEALRGLCDDENTSGFSEAFSRFLAMATPFIAELSKIEDIQLIPSWAALDLFKQVKASMVFCILQKAVDPGLLPGPTFVPKPTQPPILVKTNDYIYGLTCFLKVSFGTHNHIARIVAINT